MFVRISALAALLVLLICGVAFAAPVTLQLRVEGATTTLFEGPVTTDGHAVDGSDGTGAHPCDGTNAGANPTPGPTLTAALDDGVGRGNWHGPYDPAFQDFLIDTIGPDFGNSDTSYWGAVLNFQPAPLGGCQVQAHAGDEVLFALGNIYAGPLLRLTGPARARTGETGQVTVTDGKTGMPVAGATMGGLTTGGDGTAQVSFPSPGLISLKASKPETIRSNAVKVCVSDTGTGDCGVPPTQLGTPSRGSAVKDSRAPTAKVSGPRDGQRFVRGPRLLSGVASDDTGVTDIKLAFRRHLRGHCGWWSGKREKFVGTNCHKKFFFTIGHDASWSYLLPRSLGPGRYVLDVKAFDRARNRDEKFVRGTNRVVFYVGSWKGKDGAGAARARASAVQVMVAGKSFRRAGVERAGARLVRVGGRSCAVGVGTPLAALAALLGHGGPKYSLRDYGHCSRTRPTDASQLFVRKIGPERNHGNDGWFYKVNDRAPEIGAADLSGRRLKTGDRVLWFYCVFDDKAGSCQRSLRARSHGRPTGGKPFEVRVLAFDNKGDSTPVTGATVSLGAATAISRSDGVATLVPTGAGVQELNASKPGTVPAFPLEIRVR